jgi:hypothetical protein
VLVRCGLTEPFNTSDVPIAGPGTACIVVAIAGCWQPGIALHTFSRPPVPTKFVMAGIGSTFPRIAPFTWDVASDELFASSSAAAPATCAEAIEPPLSQP